MHTITKIKENNSTIETKYDKHENKVSMYETLKELDEEIITKENIMSLTRYHTTSLQSDNVEVVGEINKFTID